MNRRLKRPWLVVAAIAVVLAGLAAVLVLRYPGYGPKELLAGYFGRHLQSVPDERVAMELQQLAELDDVGVLVLMDALGSPRPGVASASAAILDEQLDRWQTLPRDQATRQVACLARGLAGRVERWPRGAQSAASDLALRILDWPIDGRKASRAAVIPDCEHVLRVCGTGVEAVGDATDAVTRAPSAGRRPEPRSDSPSAQVDLTATALPGGDLPTEEVGFPPLPAAVTAAPEPRSMDPREPQLLPSSGADRESAARWHNNQRTNDERPGPRVPPAALQPGESMEDSRSSIQPLSGERTLSPDARPAALSDRELIGHLAEPDPQTAAAAERILQQRGYRKADLALARKLASPDVATRRQLAEVAARLPHAADRWLIWLSQDPDPAVRSAAVSVMVTAQDPRLLRRLLEMETAEPDENVRAQLQRWRTTLR